MGIPTEEVIEKQRLEEMKMFRKYLVDSGAIKCFVKMYQHTAKHEMRMDNLTLVKDFLATYQGDNAQVHEAERLEQENFELREKNAMMQEQVEELSRELEKQQHLGTGRILWRHFTSTDFWEGISNKQAAPSGDEFWLAHIYWR